MRWLAILVLALALVAAGCGGDDDSTASDGPATEETTTAEETTPEETTDGDTTDLSGLLEDEDCLALAGVGASIAQAFSGAAQSGSETELEELANRVPEEIRADVRILAEALAEYSEKVQEIGIKPGTTPTAAQAQELQTLILLLDQERLTAASERIQAWAEENCTG